MQEEERAEERGEEIQEVSAARARTSSRRALGQGPERPHNKGGSKLCQENGSAHGSPCTGMESPEPNHVDDWLQARTGMDMDGPLWTQYSKRHGLVDHASS